MKQIANYNCIFLFFACAMLMSAPFQSSAQCSSSLKNISFNTVLTGTGNNSWGFLIPQFNPLQGTLVAVNISATVSVGYQFSLENNSAGPIAYNVVVSRHDSIYSSDLMSPIENLFSRNYGPYSLSASDGVSGSGSDYVNSGKMILLSNYNLKDSITAYVAPFIGSGYAVFNYNPATTAVVSGSTNNSFIPSANDTMHFTLTYYYCSAVVLSTTVTDFEALKENDKNIKLSWITQNEMANRTYVVQKSDDGINFSELNTVPSIASTTPADYFSDYAVSPRDRSKLYFRLKIIDEDKTLNYSEIRVVDLYEKNQTISLYPNPANDFINISFNYSANWQTEIFAANGALVQRNYFGNANSAHLGFINKLSRGAYFIHVFDTRSQKNYVIPFLVN